MQLQLAAREGAARHLFDQTGIDVRRHLDRLKPAVLRLNPPVDTNGTKYLKNEYENKLFYFLSIAEEDFLVEVSFCLLGFCLILSRCLTSTVFCKSKKEGIKLKDPVGEPNSRLKVSLC